MNNLLSPATAIPGVGHQTRMGAYTLNGHERVIYAQRIHGNVRLSDHPAIGRGRRYLIERGLEQDGYAALLALVADYIDQATQHQVIPAQDTPVNRYLNALT